MCAAITAASAASQREGKACFCMLRVLHAASSARDWYPSSVQGAAMQQDELAYTSCQPSATPHRALIGWLIMIERRSAACRPLCACGMHTSCAVHF